jgi:hypothetical protein
MAGRPGSAFGVFFFGFFTSRRPLSLFPISPACHSFETAATTLVKLHLPSIGNRSLRPIIFSYRELQNSPETTSICQEGLIVCKTGRAQGTGVKMERFETYARSGESYIQEA